MEFKIRTMTEEDSARVVVSGEVDLATADDLGDEIAAALATHPGIVMLDLGGVSFLDSSGLRSLVIAHRKAQQAHRTVRIVEASPTARVVLDASGIGTIFVPDESGQLQPGR